MSKDIIEELRGRAESGELFADKDSKLVYLPIDRLYPHPDNPRKELGDLSELAESIKAKGVMQNLTVVPYRSKLHPDKKFAGYTVIIGHRRRAAAELAGLSELPCVIVDMDERDQIATMLLENMQRSDLTAYEQAKGMQMMFDFGETVESISEKTGFSKVTVRRRLEMAKLDDKTMREVSSRQLSMSDFAALEKIDGIDKRNELLKYIGTNDFDWKIRKEINDQEFSKKKKPALSQLKKLKAKEITWSESYGGKYEKISSIKFNDWDGVSPLIENEKRPLFYRFDDNGGKFIVLYVEAPKKKTERVQKSRAEIEKAEAIKDTWARVDEFNKISFERRRDFAAGLSYKGHAAEMMRGAVLAGISAVFSAVSDAVIKDAIGFEFDKDVWDPKGNYKAMLHAAEIDTDIFPRVIYAIFDDSESNSFFGGSRSYFPLRTDRAKLVGLYTWLELCGYEVSSDERAVIGGTHEIYFVGEGYK